MHFCSAHGASCGGWWPSDAVSEARRRGVPLEWLFPYSSAFDASGIQACKIESKSGRATLQAGGDLHAPKYRRAQTVAGFPWPCLWSRSTFTPTFGMLEADVYHHVTGIMKDITVSKSLDILTLTSCWIAKNSWDTSWGDGGFFRIGYGECGIDDTSQDRDPDGSLNRFPMFGIDGVQTPSAWRGFELAAAQSISLNGGISADHGSRTAWSCGGLARTDLVQAAYWYEGSAWNRYEWRRLAALR